MLCRRGKGRAWGADLIVFVGPGVGHLTDLVLPGEGIFKWRYLTAYSTSSRGRFSLALEVGREKALALAGHMTTKHPEFVGVLN